MAGYNNRQLLVEFEDDNNGEAVATFRSNKHLRIVAPRDWQDLFRKYPPGRGIIKDRVYWNRRKKQSLVSGHARTCGIF